MNPACTRGRALAGLLAFLATLAIHCALLPAQGLTDDDDYYAPAGLRYADWLKDLVSKPGSALERAAVDRAFSLNHEHPPLAKVMFGLAHALLHDATGLMGELDAARMGTALFASLLSAVLLLLLWRPLGPLPAIAAPLLLLSLPRFLFHSQVATLDVPVACAVVVITAAFFAADRAAEQATAHARRWQALCGLLFGLGLLVKLNAPFALLACAAWAGLTRWRGFGLERTGSTWAVRVPPIPRALLWMVLLGPLVFVALWPWLWHDTLARIGGYFAFHLTHYPILHFYQGEIFERPFAPWHAVLVLGFGAMPLPVVLLGLLGVARATRAIGRMVHHADADGGALDIKDGDRLRALLLLQAALSMLIVMNPAVPRYGGEKLFMPFFPLFCALAADGLAVVVAALHELARVSSRRARAALSCALLALACAPGVCGTVKHHGGYALSYFGESMGGLRGAVASGYERSYYDVADKPLARLLDAHMGSTPKEGGAVAFLPNHKEYARTYRWLARDGYVSPSLKLEADWHKASLVVLTHERRWSTYPALLAQLQTGRYDVVEEKRIDGVPLWTLYRRR